MKIAVIGCGVMGCAFARHFAQKHTLLLSTRNPEQGRSLSQELGAEFCARPSDAVKRSDIVLLAVKPKDLAAIAREAFEAFSKHHTVISILAGTSIELLRRYFPQPLLIRAMPNLALTCGEGVIGFVQTPDISVEVQQRVEELFRGLGLLSWLSEDKLEALSALAGSGPAFIFLLIEAMIDGGILLGFTQPEARAFVLKTLEGSIALLKSTGKHPAELKGNVTSPGGTTISGLKVLEEGGVRGTLMDSYWMTFLKAGQLQK